jgi:hypothetical protein
VVSRAAGFLAAGALTREVAMSSQPIHPENERRLFEIFKMAVQDERKAQAVYL